MRALKRSGILLLVVFGLTAAPSFAQQERSSFSITSVNSSGPPGVQITESTEVGRPKYKQRITDLGDQIRLIQNKGFISQGEADKFLSRQSELTSMEKETREKGFPKPATDDLEKAITLLNEEVFKASHKTNPVKAGQAENEVNDPNLIPAYPDRNLQPGSGHLSGSKGE